MMHSIRRSAFRVSLLCLMSGCGFLVGCGYGGVPINGSSDQAATSSNWEFTVTPKSGTPSIQALSRLSGSILTSLTSQSAVKAAAVFQAVSGCFADPNVLSMDGSFANNQFSGRSFGVNGQYLTVTADLDANQQNMTGTYGVEGGCADGQSGTVVGARFNALTGTYRGVTTGATPHTISVVTTQGSATGIGTFIISGASTFDTFPCFAAGNYPILGGAVSGSSVDLLIAPSGKDIDLVGSFDRTASTISFPKFTVCGADLSPLTLIRQP